MGMGIALVLATTTLAWLEAEAIWVEAAAPVRTRTTTKARTMFFIELDPSRGNKFMETKAKVDVQERVF